MSYFSVDIEADGPCPGIYSMVSFGAVIIDSEKKLNKTFYGQLKPISEVYIPKALSVSGHSREQTLAFPEPKKVIRDFYDWIMANNDYKTGKPLFIADNNGFDWQFINYYFWRYMGLNPFGHTSRNINDLYKGGTKNMKSKISRLRKTKHTHHPVDDAKGNAEAFLKVVREFDHTRI